MKEKWTPEIITKIKSDVKSTNPGALAKELGVHRSRVHRLINGTTYTKEKQLVKKVENESLILTRIENLESQFAIFKEQSLKDDTQFSSQIEDLRDQTDDFDKQLKNLKRRIGSLLDKLDNN